MMLRRYFFLLSLILVGSIPAAMSRPDDGPLLNFKLRDIAAPAGVMGNPDFGRSVSWLDYNQDGWLDFMVANSLGPIPLYRNNGDFTFTDVSESVGLPPLKDNTLMT